jgi:hypothetical protein
MDDRVYFNLDPGAMTVIQTCILPRHIATGEAKAMTVLLRRTRIASLSLVFILLALVGMSAAQASPVQVTTAKAGEPVMLIVTKVKADKKKQFEDYMDRFGAALAKVAQTDSTVKRVAAQTRTLTPAQADPDGTFTYVFLMDPVVKDADYDMMKVLEKVLTKDEVEQLKKQFEDAVVGPQQMFALVQGK